ncbi:MAG TPA: hypothetical protein VFT42_10770 [Solirubrobacteraceae bacterium]|nr:hypothetical protein [Solirubrobacteraceae bacterium]
MESATLTSTSGRPRATLASVRDIPWPWLALGVLVACTVAGFLVYPTYPNYDSYYSLIWGREVLHGIKPSFEAYRAPTEHPLAIGFGALLSLLGRGGDRVMVGATLASFVFLAAGMYRLGRATFTPLVGLIAAALVCTRFDFPFLAARAYIDIPYLAFVIWAAALEAERPRRGMPVLALLTCAGLLRPEAWLMAGLYFLWIAPAADWPGRIRAAALAATAPAIWVAVDIVVTGRPLFSLRHTSGLAEELGRAKGLSGIPHATETFLLSLDKAPVLLAGILGLALVLWLAPRRLGMPLTLLVVGLGTFVLVGLAGLSVIDRYLLVPSLMVMVFAAVTLGGWTMLREGTLVRRLWALGAVLVVAYGVIFTVSRVNLGSFTSELKFRGESHASLIRLLSQPAVRAGRRCGPIFTPNHKLIPDTRWILGARQDDVLARSDPATAGKVTRGVALLATNRTSLLRNGLTQGIETPADTADNLPPAGFHRAGTSTFYGAYVRC